MLSRTAPGGQGGGDTWRNLILFLLCVTFFREILADTLHVCFFFFFLSPHQLRVSFRTRSELVTLLIDVGAIQELRSNVLLTQKQ